LREGKREGGNREREELLTLLCAKEKGRWGLAIKGGKEERGGVFGHFDKYFPHWDPEGGEGERRRKKEEDN